MEIPFNDNFTPAAGVVSFAPWQTLKTKSISDAVGLKGNELITGLVVSKDGIKVCIERY